MLVLKTTSPKVSPPAPKLRPVNTVPSESPNLEINRVPVRWAARIMSEAAIGVAALEGPLRCPADGLLAFRPVAAKVRQCEDRVESSVPIPRQGIDQPTAVVTLVFKDAR